jgi:phosphoribosylanthranilate isomerase
MSLKTKILIRGINNLSAARYCAGMGVDWLCFSASKDMPLEKIQAITGWISGTQFVCEFMNNDIADMQPYLEAGFHYYIMKNTLENRVKNTILKYPMDYLPQEVLVDTDQWVLLEGLSIANMPEYKNLVDKWNTGCKLMIAVDNDVATLHEMMEKIKPAAFALCGPSEIKPGMLECGALAEILESLQVLT